MPKYNIEKAMDKYAKGHRFIIYGENIMPPEEKTRIRIMANGIEVSFKALFVTATVTNGGIHVQTTTFERESFDNFLDAYS